MRHLPENRIYAISTSKKQCFKLCKIKRHSNQNKTIGFTGNTGNGNNGGYQTHLHVDIHTGTRKGGALINPSKYYANTMIYS